MTQISLFHRLSPFGPIFGKELRTTSRRKRTYALRVGYLGLLLLFLLMTYASTRSYGYGGIAYRMQQQAQMGMTFFLCFTMFSVISMGLIGPILTATAVNGERLHKTLHVLLMTPITAWQIVAGKLMSRLLGALMLIGLSLPVLALVRLLGGVTPGQMVGTVCLALTSALFGASVGLLLSTLMNRAYAVILLSYAFSLFLQLFIPFVFIAYMERGARNNPYPTLAVPALFSPTMVAGFLGTGEVRMAGMLAVPWLPAGTPLWAPCVGLHVMMSAGLVCLSATILRRQAQRVESRPSAGAAAEPLVVPLALAKTSETGVVLETFPTEGAVKPPPLPVRVDETDAQRTARLNAGEPVLEYVSKSRSKRPMGDNPVLWYELRRPLMPSKLQRILGSAAAIILLLVSYAALGERDLGQADTQIGYAFVFHFLGTLLCCVLSATAIAQEKESDTWTLLLTTPLSGGQVVWGKTLGLTKRLLWPTAFAVAHFTTFLVTGVLPLASWVLVVWVMITFNVVWLATGIYLSLRVAKTTFAVILNLCLPVLAYLVPYLVFYTISEWVSGGDWYYNWICYYLPYFYLGTGLEKLSRNSMAWLPLGNTSFAWFGVVAFMAGAVQVLLAGGILALAGGQFDRIVGRARR